ncbi:MAG: hypothetical protein E7456_04375 [Ruminococcaceae bacterium]|nr:hypothetical protein [Oscillospiraceae bacterium]
MKRLIALLIAVLMMVSMTACGSSEDEFASFPWSIGEANSYMFFQSDTVELILDEDTLTPSGASFTLVNNGEVDIQYGTGYSIQVKIQNQWYNVETFGETSSANKASLAAGEEVVIAENWASLYSVLPEGTYRIIKEFSILNYTNSFYICETFEIE